MQGLFDKAKPGIAVASLATAVVLGNWWLMREFPQATPFGDEGVYSKYAWADADRGLASLLPGRLRLTHHPPFNSHVLSQVGPPSTRFYKGDKPNDPPKGYVKVLMRRGAWFNAVLVALTVIGVYSSGILLGLGRPLAFLAATVLACLPRVVFHVHALWSETLHLFFETAFLALTLFAWRKGAAWVLVGAGAALGFAALTRMTLFYFAPFAVIGVVWMFWRSQHAGRPWKAGLVFVAGFLLVVGPQLARNTADRNGARISTNTWRNVEFGLRRQAPGDGADVDVMKWRKGSKVYRRPRGPNLHPNRLVNRELHAKQRVVAFLESLPLHRHIARQSIKMWTMLLRGNSQLAHAMGKKRWGERTVRLRSAVALDRKAWVVLVYAGLVGLLAVGWRSPGWLFLTALVGYYLAGLLVAPINARVAVQLAPALSLLACGLLHRAIVWICDLARSLRRQPDGAGP